MAKLTPVGVFAIAASTAGTMTLAEASRLQGYLIAHAVGAVLLGALVLPVVITSITPLRYRDVLLVSKTAVLTTFATGKLIIVLPLLVRETEKLFEHLDGHQSAAGETAEVVYPLAYAFPHVGKLLALIFIPFAGWFLGHPLGIGEYPVFLSAGLVSYFGGPLLATPFLLDLMHLPQDMFQLFVLSGVLAERLGDAVGAIHLVAVALITACAVTGRAELTARSLARVGALCTVVGVGAIGACRFVLASTLQYSDTREEAIAELQRVDQIVGIRMITKPGPNPRPLKGGESLLERIQDRGVLRVGYNEDKLPFAFLNAKGELVGFDVALAESLARDLGVNAEFVRFDRATLAEQLEADHFDVVMSGLVGTLERATAMEHTSPYLEVTLALVAPDFRIREFASVDRMLEQNELRIGFIDLSRGFVDRLRRALPNAELVELETNRAYFEEAWKEIDALLISAESGAAYTLLFPDFEAVVPDGVRVRLPLFYAVGARDRAMREFLEHWITLRKGDGTFDDQYERWVLGRSPPGSKPRWSVARDVLGWFE